MVLEEQSISTVGKNADWMRETQAEHCDFRDEKSMIEHMLIDRVHIPCLLPKLHPDPNPIESLGSTEMLHTSTL